MSSQDDENPDASIREMGFEPNARPFDEVIERMNSPLSASDMTCGWTTEALNGMRGALEAISVADSDTAVIMRRHLGRAMDHWGIHGGTLFHEILAANDAP